MSQRTVTVALLVAGVLLFLVALAADGLGLGAAPGLGWKQMVGAGIGVALAAYAMVRFRGSSAG